MPRPNRKKKKAHFQQAPALPMDSSTIHSFAETRYPLVMSIVSARRDGDPSKTEAAERKFVAVLLGDDFVQQDEELHDRVHLDHRHLGPVGRTEEFSSELANAIKAVRGMIPGEGYWGLSVVHPFTIDSRRLAQLWRWRHTIDHMGMPYYVFAKAAAIYWVIDRKGYHLPSIEDLDNTDVMLLALDFWSKTDEQEWKVPMRQILESCLNEDDGVDP